MLAEKKTDRILIRVSETDKARLREAARADGRSISSFILRSALLASPELTPARRPSSSKAKRKAVAA